jgi:hypothetical protein
MMDVNDMPEKPNDLYCIIPRNDEIFDEINTIETLDCPIENSAPLIHANIKVNIGYNKIVNTLCLLDSTSTHFAISIDYAKANRLYINPIDCVVTTVNGKSQVLGITNILTTTMFNKYSCGIEFYIIESNKHDMILGTNYFRAMNAGVIFEHNEVFKFSVTKVTRSIKASTNSILSNMIIILTMREKLISPRSMT